jgi:SAM-dependent methyltransferase
MATMEHVAPHSSALPTVPTSCAICRARTRERVVAGSLIRELPENQLFGGALKIVECTACGLRYLNPAPALESLPSIYSAGDVWGDSTNSNPVLMEHFLATLRAHSPGLRRVLEIGCDTGDFLAWLESKGLEVAGTEFNESAVARKKFRGHMYVGMMEDIDVPEQFDAVMLLNVIEHLTDPRAVLTKIRGMLRPGGLLLLRHPNADLLFYPPYRLLFELPKYLYHRMQKARGQRTRFTISGFQCQHLFYLDRRSTTRLLHDAGFSVVHFSTTDPYNRLRMSRAWKSGNILEGAIASVRHGLSWIGRGTECLFVATPAAR